MIDIKIPYLKCTRCKHQWIPRSTNYPKVCPRCNSPYWNKEYKRSDKINKRITKKEAEEIADKTELSYEFRNRNRKK